MPREPIASGSRAPVDSPMTTSGMPRSVAVRFMCATFLLLVALVEAPFTVKSLTTDGDVAAVDLAVAGDLAVGLRLLRLLRIDTGRAEEPRFEESARVEQRARCARAR